MILSLKDDHKQHLSILIPQPVNVLQDFCKLALDFLRKGPNTKLYQTAAQKLDVQPEVIRNAVEGLLASRALQHQVTPLVTMNLKLETKSALTSNEEGDNTSIKNIVLQTDPTNLLHITQVLEEALQESRSQHSRRIQRSFK
ncbi:hypothetical protein C0J52_09561 [Blattella germanica]|nr:hypothetical protein C0J52_09561 [Blattella germanica]